MPVNMRLVEVLHATLLDLEQRAGVSPDDPAFLSLKTILLQRIADLELEALQPISETAATESKALTQDEPQPPVQDDGKNITP